MERIDVRDISRTLGHALMHEWLSIEVVVTIMLVTAFTWVGLLAVWAAHSPRHWFVRFGVVMAVLAPLYFVPAHELLVTFLLPVGYAWAFATLIRSIAKWTTRRRENCESDDPAQPPAPMLRFSVQSLLAVVAAIAVVLATVTRIQIGSRDVFEVGFRAGSAVGVAAIFVVLIFEFKPSWWGRGFCVVVLFLQAFIAVAMMGTVAAVFFDVFFPASDSSNSIYGIDLVFWIGAFIAAILLFAGTRLFGIAISGPGTTGEAAQTRLNRIRRSLAARATFAALLSIAALPWVAFVWELFHPLPLPPQDVPNPNGYDRLIAVAERFKNSAVDKEYAADPVSYDQLAKAVAIQQGDYAELSALVDTPILIPTHYKPVGYFHNEDRISGLRKLINLLEAKNEIAIRANDLDSAVAAQKQMLQLAEVAHQGGVAFDFVVASAIDSLVTEQIYAAVHVLNKQQCLTLIDEIASHEAGRLDIDGVLHRERVWMQRADGWVGHAQEIIARWAGKIPDQWNTFEYVARLHRCSQAFARLLMVELALRAYKLDHEAMPQTLDELIPRYLTAVPADPCDPSAMPLRYKLEGDSYILYSYGDDRDDDGGRSVMTQTPDGELSNDGDIRLDEHFQTVSAPVAHSPTAGVGDSSTSSESARED